MASWSSLFGVMVALLALGLAYCADKRYLNFGRMANRSFLWEFVLVWLMGFVVYDVGMYTGEPWSLLGNVPMAILHAFGVFLLDSDVSAVHSPFHNSALYMLFFSLVHFLGALVSMMIVIKHFGFNVIAAAKFFWTSHFGSVKRVTYLFWGMNDATYYMSEDIKAHHASDEDYRIIIVRTNDDAGGTNVRNGMERLFDFLSLHSHDVDRLHHLNCLVTNAFIAFSQVDALPHAGCLDILSDQLRMRSLCRLIERKTQCQLHVFFLSDDETANLQSVDKILLDKTIDHFIDSDKQRKTIFYCHARRDSAHRVVVEETVTKERIQVKLVDTSHDSVEQLKCDIQFHPVNYVKVEHDATVSSCFHALIVGFGEVGQDMAKFLYEFGAFVKPGSLGLRAGFRCDVVDKNMSQAAGMFYANSPAVKLGSTDDNQPHEAQVVLHQIDMLSVDFYQKLEQWLKTLNYVVVAMGDDETNITLAVKVLKWAIRTRDNMRGTNPNFRILVRIKNDDDQHYARIAQHYNRLWAAEKCAAHSKWLHQCTIVSQRNEHNNQINEPITLFGIERDTYTYDGIISEKLKHEAMGFRAIYNKVVNVLRQHAGYEPYSEMDWDDERNDLMQLTGPFMGYSPTYSAKMRLQRIQAQNYANCYHRLTKQRLFQLALGQQTLSDLPSYGLQRPWGSCVYSFSGEKQLTENEQGDIARVMDVLAQTEHLRWNASHQILGYRLEGDQNHKDEARLEHGCLREWSQLLPDVQSYDYNVVDVSLGIVKPIIDE